MCSAQLCADPQPCGFGVPIALEQGMRELAQVCAVCWTALSLPGSSVEQLQSHMVVGSFLIPPDPCTVETSA